MPALVVNDHPNAKTLRSAAKGMKKRRGGGAG